MKPKQYYTTKSFLSFFLLTGCITALFFPLPTVIFASIFVGFTIFLSLTLSFGLFAFRQAKHESQCDACKNGFQWACIDQRAKLLPEPELYHPLGEAATKLRAERSFKRTRRGVRETSDRDRSHLEAKYSSTHTKRPVGEENSGDKLLGGSKHVSWGTEEIRFF